MLAHADARPAVGGVHRGDGGLGRDTDGKRRVEADAHGEDRAHALGPARGERLGEVTLAAVPDERDRSPALAVDCLEALVEPVERTLRAVDVHADTRLAGPVPHALEPARKHAERLVASEEPGTTGRASVAAGNPLAAPDRVDEDARELALTAQFVPATGGRRGAAPAGRSRRARRPRAGQRTVVPVGHGRASRRAGRAFGRARPPN